MVWNMDYVPEAVLKTTCNLTALEGLTQMDSHLFHLVKLSTLSVSCALNIVLSIPLLLAIGCTPSLLVHTRFFILTHLLCCDSLQGLPVAQCLVFSAALQGCSMVDLLLNASLALDRLVAIKWPLRYALMIYPRRQRLAVGLIWTSSVLISVVTLCMALTSMQVNARLPRCRPLIFAPCLSAHPAFQVLHTVVAALVLLTCYITTLGCFLLLCWDTRGVLCSQRAVVTLALQAAQTLFYSLPVMLYSSLLPIDLHHDAVDLAATTAYNLGISLIPLVYGYRSRELQKRLIQASQRSRVISLS